MTAPKKPKPRIGERGTRTYSVLDRDGVIRSVVIHDRLEPVHAIDCDLDEDCTCGAGMKRG